MQMRYSMLINQLVSDVGYLNVENSFSSSVFSWISLTFIKQT